MPKPKQILSRKRHSFLYSCDASNCGTKEITGTILSIAAIFIAAIGFLWREYQGSIEFYKLTCKGSEIVLRIYPEGINVEYGLIYIFAGTGAVVIILYWFLFLPVMRERESDSRLEKLLSTSYKTPSIEYSLGSVNLARGCALLVLVTTVFLSCLTANAKLPQQQTQKITAEVIRDIPYKFTNSSKEEGKVVEFLVKVINPGNSPNKEINLTTLIEKDFRKRWFITNALVYSGEGKNRKLVKRRIVGYSGSIATQESSSKGEFRFYFRDPNLKRNGIYTVELYIHAKLINHDTFEIDPDANIADLDNRLKDPERIPLSLSLTP